MNLKKFLAIFTALTFAFSLLTISLLEISKAETENQGEEIEVIELGEKEWQEFEGDKSLKGELITEDNQRVDYYLPYPGILPDHPLYWLKMLRDRLMLLFTRNPLERWQRLLLYADKRIGAAQALINGGKSELGLTTATKAEKYYSQAVELVLNLEKEKKAGWSEKERLIKAGERHRQICQILKSKVNDEKKSVFENIITNLNSNLEKLYQ